MSNNFFNKKIFLVSTLILFLFFSSTTVVKANMFSDLSANVWNSIGDFLFGTTKEEVPPPTVVIPPKVKTTNTVPIPSPVVTKGAGLTTYVTNTLTDDQIYTALTKLKKLPQNIIDLLHVSTPIVTNVYNNSTSGGSGGTVNDSNWHKSGKNNISHSGSVSVDGDLGVTGTSTLADLKPQTPGNATNGVTKTLVLTADPDGNGGDNLNDDSQKFLVMGADGLPRFVYYDNDYADIHFVQCLNADCSSINDNVVAHGDNGVDVPSLVIAPDGFARITYNTYDTPNEIHYIRCENNSCTTNNNVIVDTSDSVGEQQNYDVEVAVGADGFGRMVWDNYDDVTVKLRFAVCNDADCSNPTLTTLSTDNTGGDYESQAIQIASDGFPRIAYVDGQNSEIHYIQCTNDDCSDNSNQVVDTDINGFYIDMVLGSDGFGRIVYGNYPDNENFAQCTNIDCSESNTTTLVADISDEISIVMGNDDLPRIAYNGNGNGTGGVYYIQCTSADCTSNNPVTINSTGGYPTSLTLGDDGFARILYNGSNHKSLYLARLGTDDGSDVMTGSTIGTSDTPFGQIYGTIFHASQLSAIGNVDITGNLTVTGNINGTPFDLSSFMINNAVGDVNALAIGVGATNNGPGSSGGISIGYHASTAFGADGAIALGINASTANPFGITIGENSSVTNDDGIAIGAFTLASGQHSLVVGLSSISAGTRSIVLGEQVHVGAGATDGIAIGTGATIGASQYNSIAIGALVTASAPQSIIIGIGGYTVSGQYSVSLGQSNVSGSSSVGIGSTTISGSSSFGIGNTVTLRQGHNVGIGTSIDDGNFGGVSMIGYLLTATGNNQVLLGTDTSTDFYIGNPTSSGPSPLTFHGHGALGGSNITGGSLTLAAGQSTGSAAGGSLIFQTSPAGGSGTSQNALAEVMRITPTGFVGINNSSPSVALDITGDIEYTGTITDVSDRRLKENITDFSGALNIISKLEAKNYNMISSPDKPEVGFIAQDVQSLFPSATSIIDPTNGYLGVSYVSLVPVVAEAVKELNLKVDNLTVIPTEGSNSFLDNIIAWFADAGNGIGDFFANRVHTKEICVTKSDGSEFCANGDQLESAVLGSSNTTGGSDGDTNNDQPTPEDTTPAPDADPEPSPASDIQTPPATDVAPAPVEETVPEPTGDTTEGDTTPVTP